MAKDFARQFYNSRPWKEMREYVLKRDCFTCNRCGRYANEVHHKIELTKSNISNWKIALNPDNLVSLCGECHKAITQNQKIGNNNNIFKENEYMFDRKGNPIPPGGSR